MTKPQGTPPAQPTDVDANIDRLTLGAGKSARGPALRAPKLGHVLVALDGSAPSLLALEWAIGLAKSLRAKLTVVSVAPPAGAPGGSVVAESAAVRAIFEEFEEDAASVLERAKESVTKAGLRCKTALLRGAPAPEIARAARDLDADLVVLGSHGHGTLERIARLGSVAESVKHHAPCSVLLARTPFPTRQVVLGTDGSRPSRLAVAVGLRLAALLGAGATVVHAFDLLYGFAHATPPSPEARLKGALEPDALSFTEGAHYRFRIGNASATLLQVAKKARAGLIVVGSRGLGSVRGTLLGSVSDRVTRNAEASVLVVKPAR